MNRLLACLFVLWASAAVARTSFSHPPRLVDAHGKTIGTLSGFSNGASVFLFDSAGRIVSATVQSPASGFYPSSPRFAHEAPDCSDARLLDGYADAFSFTGFATNDVDMSNSGTKVYYPIAPFADHNITAIEAIVGSGNPFNPPTCHPTVSGYCCVAFADLSQTPPIQVEHAGAVGALDVSRFVLPFSVK